jgi:hypothetical protein
VLQKKLHLPQRLKLPHLLLLLQLQFQPPLLPLPRQLHQKPLLLLHLLLPHLVLHQLHQPPPLFKLLLLLLKLQELHLLLEALVMLVHTTVVLTLLRILRMHMMVLHQLRGKKDLKWLR